MSASDPDRLVNDFITGRLSRRQLIANLMAMGAAAGGMTGLARAAPQDRPSPPAPGPAPAPGSADPPRDAAPTFAAQMIDHLALNVTDIPRSREWYMKHLGLRVMSETRASCFLRCGNGRDFLALFRAEKPGMHHYSFGIPEYDQDEAAKRLRAAGLTPKLRGRRLYFDDPDGLEVQVSQG